VYESDGATAKLRPATANTSSKAARHILLIVSSFETFIHIARGLTTAAGTGRALLSRKGFRMIDLKANVIV
jgi:hypothetical protein